MKLTPGVAVDIMAAESVGRHRLRLTFSDGHVSIVDFGGFLRSSLNPETREFMSEARFKKFSLLHGNLVWGDYEMCFSNEDLYEGMISTGKSVDRRLALAEARKVEAKKGSLVEFLRKSPIFGEKVELSRSRETARKVDL